MRRTCHLKDALTLVMLAMGIALQSSAPSAATELELVKWNLDADDSDPLVIAKEIIARGEVDIWALSEVKNRRFIKRIESNLEHKTRKDFVSIVGKSHDYDRQAIVYNNDVLSIVGEPFEIEEFQLGLAGIPPALGVRLNVTTTGQEFFVLLATCTASSSEAIDTRPSIHQAQALNVWARARRLPVILATESARAYDVGSKASNLWLMELVQEGPFRWMKPEPLMPTVAEIPYVEDFIMVANPSAGMTLKSEILILASESNPHRAAMFQDFQDSSDHRPVRASLTFDSKATIARTRQGLVSLREQENALVKQYQAMGGGEFDD
jgi:hypothetical protein